MLLRPPGLSSFFRPLCFHRLSTLALGTLPEKVQRYAYIKTPRKLAELELSISSLLIFIAQAR